MQLRECPFCGGEPSMARPGTARQSCIVVCIECGARHESGDVGERSGSSWNRRASDRQRCATCRHMVPPKLGEMPSCANPGAPVRCAPLNFGCVLWEKA